MARLLVGEERGAVGKERGGGKAGRKEKGISSVAREKMGG